MLKNNFHRKNVDGVQLPTQNSHISILRIHIAELHKMYYIMRVVP